MLTSRLDGISETNSRDNPPDARPIVAKLLDEAVERGASDIHVEPTALGYEVRFRVDGLLETATTCDRVTGRSIVARLMVMGHLLTYRQDIPQEGRLTATVGASAKELNLRLAIIPTTNGLRAAVRMPAELIQPRTLNELNLPTSVFQGLIDFAAGDSGMLILTGPAGSGKTTTIYALLDHIKTVSPGVSIVALEDPVERDLPGVTQIEIAPFGQLTYERALRSILRQDPQVLMLGEIRDAATATLAVQAALSGHRLISTFHAASAASAVARLIEMGIEPYQITSSLHGIVSQRLVRQTQNGKYKGRLPLAEYLQINSTARAAILQRTDAASLQNIFRNQPGFVSMRTSAEFAAANGLTDQSEINRALGIEADHG